MAGSLLQAIISGSSLELPGFGQDSGGSGLTILFPLSWGDTVSDLANTLNLPADSILAVNPGLQVDSQLSVSQIIALPSSHIDTIMRSVDPGNSRIYGPSPSLPDVTLPPNAPRESYSARVPSDSVSVALPPPRSSQIAFDVLNTPQRNPLLAPLTEDTTNRQFASVGSPEPLSLASESNQALGPWIMSVVSSEPANGPGDSRNASIVPVAGQAPATATSAPIVDRGGSIFDASSHSLSESIFSGAQATNGVMQAGQNQQRNLTLNAPPPIPMMLAGSRDAVQLTSLMPLSGSICIVPSNSLWNSTFVPSDSHQTTLQLMGLLVAQLGSSTTMGSTTLVSAQGPAFIDPQAVAAQAANMRAGRVIELGAGRSLEFSLVTDRMRRIDAIGQEERAASRRTGDGLEELRVRQRDDEETEQTDEQREQGRRRRAAIAAMRRRRRPRSKRCRYWRGSRSILITPGARRYPKSVDLAEYHSRQPPWYLWRVESGD